jgi:UPF0755 protein
MPSDAPTEERGRRWRGRLTLGALLVAAGVVAWAAIAAMVVVLTVYAPTPTTIPTLLPATATAPVVALVPSETPPPSPLTETPLPSPTVRPSATPSATLTLTEPPPGAITATPLVLFAAVSLSATAETPISTEAASADSTADSAAPAATAEVVYLIVTNTPEGTPSAATPCTPPDGWVAYSVQEGDTWFGFQLGSNNTVNVEALLQANCTTSKALAIGQTVYLPPGTADAAPKIDIDAVPPSGPSRVANCPCSLRVREGWRLEQIAAAVNRLPLGFSGQEFLAVTGANAPGLDTYGFLTSKPAGKTLEGFMFPGDYSVENTTSAVDFRNMLLNAFAAAVPGDVSAALAGRGLTLWEGINLASIVQRESYEPEAQKLIAGIFYNRRAREMGIASFVTLQYALGVPGNWWPRITRANLNTETPYATHRYKGLPPSPISNPGLGAIYAVAYPTASDYLYFSAKCGGGGNFYARTFEEFQQGLKCN